jgi:hypothetical protein
MCCSARRHARETKSVDTPGARVLSAIVMFRQLRPSYRIRSENRVQPLVDPPEHGLVC